jgi:hypothetical protein
LFWRVLAKLKSTAENSSTSQRQGYRANAHVFIPSQHEDQKMSRLVRPDVNAQSHVVFRASPVAIVPGEAGAPAAPSVTADVPTSTTAVDNYATRIVKYIPAEVIAFYLAADKLFAPSRVSGAAAQPAANGDANFMSLFISAHSNQIAAGIFVAALIATPLYLWKQAEQDQPWLVNVLVSTIAFAIWAYATQGAVFAPVYDARIASLAILSFTLLSGFIVPGKPSVTPAQHKGDSASQSA